MQKRYLSLGSLALLTDEQTEPSGPADADPPTTTKSALAGVGKATT